MVFGILNKKHSKILVMANVTDWLKQEPDEGKVSPAPGGGLHIEIQKLEDDLDTVDWSTQNFKWQVFKNGYADNVIAASIELVLEYMEDDRLKRRIFVGGCNFSINAIFPNVHYVATAKSMCIKNAASDAGRKLGRWLNQEIVPAEDAIKQANDGIDLLNSIDEVKPEHHVKEKQHKQDSNTKR